MHGGLLPAEVRRQLGPGHQGGILFPGNHLPNRGAVFRAAASAAPGVHLMYFNNKKHLANIFERIINEMEGSEYSGKL